MPRFNRRTVLKATGVSIAGSGFAGCLGGSGDGEQMDTLEPEGAITVPVFLYGNQNGAWAENDINLSLEVAAFAKFVRQINEDLSHIGGVSVPSQISFANQGTDLTMVGQQLNLSVRMFTKANSDIETVEDLSDKTLGVPPESTTTTNSVKAMIQDNIGFNIMEDTGTTRTSPPPTLLGFLDDNEVDAVLLFSGDTVSAAASNDYRTIYDPYQVWKDKTGYAPPMANYTVKTSWLESNPETARNFLDGWSRALELFSENTSEAITNFGMLGGVTTDAEAEVAKQWQSDGILFGPEEYSSDLADSNWQLIETMAEYGTTFSETPDKDSFITTADELADL